MPESLSKVELQPARPRHIFSLDQLPLRGAPVKARPGLRKLSHRYYLIYYRINEPMRLVEIVRIWDGRKNPASLALP